MSKGTIPRDHSWCSYCIVGTHDTKEMSPPIYPDGIKGLCEHHKGPDGQPKPYEGHDVYEPSEWVREVVGRKYLAWDAYLHVGPGETSTRVWECFGYDPRNGFWMRAIDDRGPARETNISERAIGRTWHELHMTYGAWHLLEIIEQLGRLPSEEEAKEVSLKLASETLCRHGFLSREGSLTEAGSQALKKHPEGERYHHLRV